MNWKVAVLFVFAVWLAACAGRGAIFLTLEAVGSEGMLNIPEEVDRVDVRVQRVDNDEVVFEKSYALDGALKFPLSLSLEEGSASGKRVRVGAIAYQADTRVGEAIAEVDIFPAEVTSVTLRMLRE